jgi:hypothetical protein
MNHGESLKFNKHKYLLHTLFASYILLILKRVEALISYLHKLLLIRRLPEHELLTF